MPTRKQTQSKRAFTITEAADYACVSRGTLYNWMVSGLLPFEELPGRGSGSYKFRLIRRQDLDKFLDSHYCPQARVDKDQTISKELLLLRDDD